MYGSLFFSPISNTPIRPSHNPFSAFVPVPVPMTATRQHPPQHTCSRTKQHIISLPGISYVNLAASVVSMMSVIAITGVIRGKIKFVFC